MSETRFTDQHEWVRLDGGDATVGITKYRRRAIGRCGVCRTAGKRPQGRRRAAKPRWWKASRRRAKSMRRSAAK